MAVFGEIHAISQVASGDQSARQYHIMSGYLGANCAMASLTTDQSIIGVLQNAPQNGETATIGYLGRSKVVAGASATINTLFTTNGSGRAISVTGSRQMVVGRFLEAPGADGDVVSALLFPSVVG